MRTAGANGVELTSTAVILTGAQPTPRRQQVVIVTHNANLLINAEADQIILAEVGTASAGGLRLIRYQSGGLDERGSAPWCATFSKAASWPSRTARGVSGSD